MKSRLIFSERLPRRSVFRPISTCLYVFLLATVTSVAQACPTCKDSISENSAGLQQGYALSILLMMAMPFIIFTGWILFAVYSRRRWLDRGVTPLEGSGSIFTV